MFSGVKLDLLTEKLRVEHALALLLAQLEKLHV